MNKTLWTVNGLTIDDPDGAIPSAFVFDEFFPADAAFFQGWYDSDNVELLNGRVADLPNRITTGDFAGYHFAELAAGNGPTLVPDVGILGLDGIGSGFMNGRPAMHFNADSVMSLCQPDIFTPAIFPPESSGLAIVMAPIGSPAGGVQSILAHSSSGRRMLFRVNGSDEIRHAVDESTNGVEAAIVSQAPAPVLLMAGWTRDDAAPLGTVTLSKNGGAVSSASKPDAEVNATQLNLGGPQSGTKQLIGLVYGILQLSGDPHLPENVTRRRAIEAWASSRYGVSIG